MFRHRILVAVSAALWMLAGFVADAGAITVNVTALPPSSLPACVSVPNAVPNDSGSDQPAFDCAVALIGASSPSLPGEERGTIYVPAGLFRLIAPLSIIDKHVSIRGEGQRISQIVWNHGGDGIYFESTHHRWNYTLAVRSISLLTSAAGGAAIHGIWPPVTEGHWDHGIVTTVLHDIHIAPAPSSSAYWDIGIHLRNSTTSKIDMFNIQGAAATSGIAGIQIDAYNPSASPTDDTTSIGTQIRNGTILKYVRGIEGKTDHEGMHVQDVSIREVSWGIQMTEGVGTTLANNFIQARYVGIELLTSPYVAVTNNVIHQFETTEFVGIRLNDVGATRVIGNTIWSPSGPGPNRDGIVLQNLTFHSLIEGNNTSAMNHGILITGTAAFDNVVQFNINNATIPVTNGGTGANIFTNNH